MTNRLPFAELVLLVTPFVIWSLAFIALYALHSLGCELGWRPGVARGVMAVAWGGHIALAGTFLMVAVRRRGGESAARFVRDATAGLAAAGLVSTIWTGLPVILSDLCT